MHPSDEFEGIPRQISLPPITPRNHFRSSRPPDLIIIRGEDDTFSSEQAAAEIRPGDSICISNFPSEESLAPFIPKLEFAKSIELTNCFLGPSLVDVVGRNKSLECLSYGNDRFDPPAISCLARVVIGSKSLRKLSVSRIPLTHATAAIIADILVNAPLLEEISLYVDWISDDDGVMAVIENATHRAKRLDAFHIMYRMHPVFNRRNILQALARAGVNQRMIAFLFYYPGGATPRVRFLAKDGDNACVHRILAFLV